MFPNMHIYIGFRIKVAKPKNGFAEKSILVIFVSEQ